MSLLPASDFASKLNESPSAEPYTAKNTSEFGLGLNLGLYEAR